ncbi:hypothetical protein EB093_03620 [bacterium]|nr:hypothetical protein [bacterium]
MFGKTVLFVLIFLGFMSVLAADDTNVTITGELLKYRESDHKVILEDNVTIQFDSATMIGGDSFEIDTSSNIAVSTGTVTIKNGAESFNSQGIKINLDTQESSLSNIDVSITPIDGQRPIFATIKSATHKNGHYYGEESRFTTCDQSSPHYWTWSQYFDYEPGSHIFSVNHFIYMPILGIPFGLWTPLYYYQVGERQLIWNNPTIGKRDINGWGWFVQNTIDYDLENNKSSSIYLDWYEFQGIGLGVRHNYTFENLTGDLYVYHLKEEGFNLNTDKKSLTFTWPEGPFTLKGSLDSMDGERLNSIGREAHDYQDFGLTYSDIGENYTIGYSNRRDYTSRVGNKSISVDYNFNGSRLVEFSASEKTYDAIKAYTNLAHLGTKIDLPNRLQWAFNTDFSRNSQSSGVDDQLGINTTFTQRWAPNFYGTLSTNYEWDIDGDTVTSDVTQWTNKVFALPKLTINYINSDWLPIPMTYDLTIARLLEYNYFSAQKALRTYPNSGDFGLEPNTIMIKASTSHEASGLPLIGTVNTQVAYCQNVFKNPGRSWSESDAGYTLSLSETFSSVHFGFIKTEGTYTNQFAPNTNNSPYLSINLNNTQKNLIEGKIKFFSEDPKQPTNKTWWSHSSQYNWLTARWDIYITEIGASQDEFSGTIRSGKKLNPQSFELENPYQPIDVNLKYMPTKNISVDYGISFEGNDIITRSKSTVLQSRINTSFVLDTTPEYQWEIQATLRYNTSGQTGSYDWNRYELESLSIVKQDHCRTFRFEYNKLANEYSFQLAINAFPDDKISVKRTKDQWKFQGGYLNDTAQERL